MKRQLAEATRGPISPTGTTTARKTCWSPTADGWVTLFYLTPARTRIPSFTPGTRVVGGQERLHRRPRRALQCDGLRLEQRRQEGHRHAADDNTDYYFHKNIGTNTKPRSGAGDAVEFNGDDPYPTYSRPNLGSYVDWDGDGKKDFIGCTSRTTIRFYKNTGTNGGVEPDFRGLGRGYDRSRRLQIMMISGADAKDWNCDGDLDILTGQGHGGSGLRFYERDYINDYVNNTFPIVSQGSSERGRSLLEARSLSDGAAITIPQGIVSACYNGFFYIQTPDRLSGLRVVLASHGRSIGERVDVRGTLSTTSAGERCIVASSVTLNP